MPMPLLLALDASTEVLHLALGRGETCWVARRPGGAAASTELLPALDELLDQAGVTLAELDAIAYGAGPGAFTGLRSACAVAQGLALGLGKPVLALDTLMAVAEDARRAAGLEAGVVAVANDARMQQAYAARYRYTAGAWTPLEPAALVDADALPAWWARAPGLRAGSALQAFGLVGQAGDQPEAEPGGAALAALARRAWDEGQRLDPALAQPRYVRDRVALTTAERAAGHSLNPAPR